MMQTDVKATSLSDSGSVASSRTRIRGVTISYASGGTVIIKDGGTNGTVVFSFTAPAAAGAINIIVPGEGILCLTDAYATLTNATAVVYYG